MISDIIRIHALLSTLAVSSGQDRFEQHAQITRNVTTERQPLCNTVFTTIHKDGNVKITIMFTVTYYKRHSN